MLDEKSGQHLCDLLTTLNRFRREDLYCDVSLTFREQAISAHGLILAAASPFFHEMLKGQTQGEKTQIQLSNMSMETGEIIVEHIYTGSTNGITKETVCELLPSVHAFGMTRMIEVCENILMSMANTKRCLEVWKIATSVNMWSIINKCTMHIRRTFPQDFTSSYFLAMSFEDAAFFISECPLNGEQRLETIKRWVHHDLHGRENYVEQFQQKFPYLINPLEEMKGEEKNLESNDQLPIKRESKAVKRKHGDVIAENIIYVDEDESVLTKSDSDSVLSATKSPASGRSVKSEASTTIKEPVHMTRSKTKGKTTKASRKPRASQQRTTRSLSEVLATLTYERPTAMQIMKPDTRESNVPEDNLHHDRLSEQCGQMKARQDTNVANVTDDTSDSLLKPNEQTDLDARSEHTGVTAFTNEQKVDHSEVSTDEPMDILNVAITSTIHPEVTATTDKPDVTITAIAQSEDSGVNISTDQSMDKLDTAAHSEDRRVSVSIDEPTDKLDVTIAPAAHSEVSVSIDEPMDKLDVTIAPADHSEVSASTDEPMDNVEVVIAPVASTDEPMDNLEVVIAPVAHSEVIASTDDPMDKDDVAIAPVARSEVIASTDEPMDNLEVIITPVAHSEVSASTDDPMDKDDVAIAPVARSEVIASTDESVGIEASTPNVKIVLITESNDDSAVILNAHALTLEAADNYVDHSEAIDMAEATSPCTTDNEKTTKVQDSDDNNATSVEAFYDDNASLVDISDNNNTRSTFLIIPEQAMFGVADILTIGTTVVTDTEIILTQLQEAIPSKDEGESTYKSRGNNRTSTEIESTELSPKQQETLQCEICKTPFISPEMLRVHLSKGHGDDSSAFVFAPDETMLAVSDMLAIESNNVNNAEFSPAYIPQTTEMKATGSNTNFTSGTMKVETRMLTRGKKSHQCTSCEKIYASPRTLRTHIHKCHGENAVTLLNEKLSETANTKSEKSYLCQICGKAYKSLFSCKYHMRFHPGEDWREKNPSLLKNCPLCNKGFPSTSQVRRHIKLRHKGEQCFIPDARRKAGPPKPDRPKPNADGNFECPECSKEFHSLTGMRAHSFSHSDKIYECEICSRKFRFERVLEKHKKNQHVDWKCTICGKQFDRSMYLQRHLKVHQETKSAECKICGKWFTPSVLRCHMYIHKRYFCDVCGKVIRNRESFAQHKLKHCVSEGTKPEKLVATKPEKPAKIKLEKPAAIKLEKPVATKPKKPAEQRAKRMKKQATTDINDENVECPICKKQMKSKKALTFHTKVHSTQKPYKCQICSKGFRTLESCRYHVTFHPGQNWRESRSSLLHHCTICNKGFPNNSQVTRHMVQHRSGIDVECKLCGASYQTPQYLRIHMKAHKRNPNWRRTKESLRHSCDVCERAFVSIRQLKRHTCHKKSHNAGSKPVTGLKGNHDAGIKSEDTEKSDTEQD